MYTPALVDRRPPDSIYADLRGEDKVSTHRAGEVVESRCLFGRDLLENSREAGRADPKRVGVNDGIARQPELAKIGLVVQLDVEFEGHPCRQGLAPQQLVVATKSRTVTVRVFATGIGPNVKARVDWSPAIHSEMLERDR